MMPFTSSFLSLFFVLLLLDQTNSSMAAPAHSDIILESCKRCAEQNPKLNYTLCIESLASVPESHHANVQGLAIIAVKLAKANMTLAKSKVEKLLKAKPADRRMRNCLLTCEEIFSNTIPNLKDSMKSIVSGQYKAANIQISSAVDAPDDCENSFQELNIKSPLTEENNQLFGLAVIALSITTLLD